MTHALRFLALAVVVAGLAGCGSQSEGTIAPPASALYEVADLLRASPGGTSRGLAELAALEPQYPRGYEAVKSGEVVVLWGAQMPGEGSPGTDAVIAFEKKTPTEGGHVLLLNGTVRVMTADEFRSAPKAQ